MLATNQASVTPYTPLEYMYLKNPSDLSTPGQKAYLKLSVRVAAAWEELQSVQCDHGTQGEPFATAAAHYDRRLEHLNLFICRHLATPKPL